MPNLKDKLAQKVEYIDGNEETSENVILLNRSESAKTVSVIPDFATSINEAKERIIMLQNFVKEMMIPNIDYGVIPGCSKPSLMKSGAEKLCDIFGFSKQLEVTNRIEDYEKGFFSYEIKVTLINKKTGLIEADGIGSCNNFERKYKKQDGFTLSNTILKMAKKRALIDAVLSATRSSDIFAQDMEDICNEGFNKKPEHETKNIPNQQVPIQKVYTLAKSQNIPADFIKKIIQEKYKVKNSTELAPVQIEDLYKLLLNSRQILNKHD